MSHEHNVTRSLLDFLREGDNLTTVLSFGIVALVVIALTVVAVLPSIKSLRVRRSAKTKGLDVEIVTDDATRSDARKEPAE